jgi:hypothetical protein
VGEGAMKPRHCLQEYAIELRNNTTDVERMRESCKLSDRSARSDFPHPLPQGAGEQKSNLQGLPVRQPLQVQV